MAPLVSVVLPFYENEATIRESVESVLSQTWTDLELIAVDDGSGDGSFRIVAELARSDDRIRVLRQANAGVAAARNAGVQAARGRYCAFQDADDVWLPHKLEAQLELVGDRTLVYSDARVQDGRDSYPWARRNRATVDSYPRGDVYEALLAECFVATPTVIVPTDLLRDAGGFDTRLRTGEDHDLWLRLASDGVDFDYVPEPLVVVRRPGSLTSDPVLGREGRIRSFRVHETHVSGPRRSLVRRRIRTAREELELFLRHRAWRSVLAGETRAARRDLVHSLSVRPLSPRAWLALSLTLCPPLARRVVRGRA